MTLRPLVALTLLAAAPMVARAQQPAPGMPPVPPPAISVTANGEVRITPDRAMVTVGTMTKASTAAAAGAENARKQQAILDTLRKMGFTSEQLSTTGYNVSPDMRYNPETGEGTITGYTVRNAVRVDIRKVEQVGPVIDAALKKGSNEIQGIAFYSSQADSARREALADAVKQARADAEVLARAAGGQLGELLELSTAGMVRPYDMMAVPVAAMRGKSESTPVEPGQQTVSAMVSARWKFIGR